MAFMVSNVYLTVLEIHINNNTRKYAKTWHVFFTKIEHLDDWVRDRSMLSLLLLMHFSMDNRGIDPLRGPASLPLSPFPDLGLLGEGFAPPAL